MQGQGFFVFFCFPWGRCSINTCWIQNGFLSRRLLSACPWSCVPGRRAHTHPRTVHESWDQRGPEHLSMEKPQEGRKDPREERDDGSIQWLGLLLVSQDFQFPARHKRSQKRASSEQSCRQTRSSCMSLELKAGQRMFSQIPRWRTGPGIRHTPGGGWKPDWDQISTTLKNGAPDMLDKLW